MNGFGMATAEIISRFEEYIGFLLPEDYKTFLMKYNGGTPKIKYSTFFVEAQGKEIPLNALLGLGINKFNLKKRFDEQRGHLLPDSLIIGDTFDKGVIVLANGDVSRGIYYCECVSSVEEIRQENGFYKVANSFHDFLKKLKNDGMNSCEHL